MEMRGIKSWVLLLLILFLAGGLRLWKLDIYPVSLNVDEISIGYNAYSILKSGRDQYGRWLPLIVESIGDFKPALYVYLVSLAEMVVGINEWAIRLPSALAGVGVVGLSFWLVRLMTKRVNLALMTAGVLAVSPWHIFMSRGGFEASVALFLFLLGMGIFLSALFQQRRSFFWGLFWLMLSALTYHSYKVVAPVFGLSLVWIFRKEVFESWKKRRPGIDGFLLAGLILLFLYLVFLSGTWVRGKSVMIFNAFDFKEGVAALGLFDNLNYWLVAGVLSLRRFLEYFDLSFLFGRGLDLLFYDNLEMGVLYGFEVVGLFWGLRKILRLAKKMFVDRRLGVILTWWLVLTVLPAALTMNHHHLIRPLALVVFFSFVVALGWWSLLRQIKGVWRKKLVAGAIVVLYLGGLVHFGDYYLINYVSERSHWWFEGSREVAEVILEQRGNYDQIVVDYNYGKEGPYLRGTPDIYVLFYGKIDPFWFWENKTEDGFANVHFRPINWKEDRFLSRSLFVASPWSWHESYRGEIEVKQEIKFADGQVAYWVANRKMRAEEEN